MNNINTKKIFIVSLATMVTFGAGISFALNNEAVKTEAVYSPGTTYTVTTPAVYYSTISNSLSGTSLLGALQTLNSSNRKRTMGYKSMGTNSSNSPYAYTDYNPNASVQTDSKGQRYSTNLVSFYTKKPMTSYNKEHVWPESRGGSAVEADIHMPRPTISVENNSRGNSFYVEGRATSNNGWDPFTEGYNEISRGESARIIFYCMVASSNLNLSDEVNISKGGAGYTSTMGKLSDMLKWNLQYSTSVYEQNRNNGAQYLQGNRNPFIDHPEYACKIWGNTNSTTQSICSSYGEAPNAITLSPSTSSIAIGGTVTLNVNVDSGSNDVTWSSSSNSIATVSNGVVTGVTAGTATITATSTLDNTIKGTATITVKALSSLNYSGTPNTTTYSAGQSFNPAGLTVTATYSDSSTANVTSSVSWTPSPLTAGTTSVTGSYGGKTITVSGLTVTSNKTMIINKTNSGLPTTKTTSEMTKSYTVKNGANNDGTMSIRWGAGVYNTAQYDEFALPNGVKIQPGDTTYVKSIKADLYGYINSDVYANGVKVTGVEGEPSANGNSKMLTYTINSNNWYIIGNTAAYDQCFYSIEFSIGEGSSPINRSVTGVSLNKNTLTLETGKSETLSATINPTDATNKNVTWSSNNTSVATVNSSGAVSALAAGNATITVTTVDGSFTANCAVTVQPASLETVYVTSVELNKNSLSLEAEKNETLTVTINPTNATNKNVTWSSNQPAFVSVSSTGVVTAIEVGIAIITVTTEDGSFTDTCEVTVTAKTITPNGNGGCGGSIAITSGLIAALSAVGIVAILIKKKKYFIK
jgi:uncharacterized protein YjdB